MSTPDDPIYELRLYHVEPGRMHDMIARVRNDLNTLFPRHGVRPAGAWEVTSGPASPLFVYLTPWRHMHERSQSWAGFYADPTWAEVRARTNAGSELVERYEILFLRAVSAWNARPAEADDAIEPGFAEMVIQSVAIGMGAAVREELTLKTLPALQAAGAFVHAVFDVMSGRPLPSVVYFVRWTSHAQRARALAALDLRTLERRRTGSPVLLERADQYLLKDVPVDWA
jgi:hypothetical protein